MFRGQSYCFIITTLSDSRDPWVMKTLGTQVVEETGMLTWTETKLPLGASRVSLLLTVFPLPSFVPLPSDA